MNTITGIGNDIIEIARIRHAIERYGNKFLDKVFTEEEQQYCQKHRESARHFAGRFAAKEAIIKAIGTGFRNGISWLDIEIKNNPHGKPTVTLSKRLQTESQVSTVMLSISHCREYATAMAIVFG